MAEHKHELKEEILMRIRSDMFSDDHQRFQQVQTAIVMCKKLLPFDHVIDDDVRMQLSLGRNNNE